MSEDTWNLMILEERRASKVRMEAVCSSCVQKQERGVEDIVRKAEETGDQRYTKKAHMKPRGCSAERGIPRENRSRTRMERPGVTRIDDQLNRWKEHFQEFLILNRSAPENPSDLGDKLPWQRSREPWRPWRIGRRLGVTISPEASKEARGIGLS